MKNNDDFLKKLAPKTTEEMEEIMKRYPIPDIRVNSDISADNGDEHVVDEPVEVILKTPWYRSRVFYAAASLVLAGGIAAGAALALPKGLTNCPSYDMTEQTEEEDETAGYLVIPVSDEVKNQAYFGSEFPRIVYADEDVCIFSFTYMLFVYDFNEQAITYSANIETTLEVAAKQGLEVNYHEFIAMEPFRREDGTVGILCTTGHLEMDSVMHYVLDIERNRIDRSEGNELNDLGLVAGDVDDLSEVNDALLGKAFRLDLENFVYLTTNGSCDDVEPGFGSQLPMLEIVKYNAADAVGEVFTPFADMVSHKDEMPATDGVLVEEPAAEDVNAPDVSADGEEKSIPDEITANITNSIPHDFRSVNIYDTGRDHMYMEIKMPNGDTVFIVYNQVNAYEDDSEITPEDVMMQFENKIYGSYNNNEGSGLYAFDPVTEELTLKGCPFKHFSCIEPFDDGTVFNTEMYYGVVPADKTDSRKKYMVRIGAFTDSTDENTLEFTRNTAKSVYADLLFETDIND